MLLHIDNGRPEFLHRAEGAPQLGYLRLGRPLTHRPAHKPEREHRAQETDKHPTPDIMLMHTVLSCVAVASVVTQHRCDGIPDLSACQSLAS